MIEGGIPARALLATDGSGDAAQRLLRQRRAAPMGDRQTWNYRYPGCPVERNSREER